MGMGTNKEQKIRIESSSGLTDQEIDQMVKDAESHSVEDEKRKEEIETRNNADSLVYSTEKSLNEYGDKVSEEDRNAIQQAIDKLKESLKGENVEAIKADTEALTQASHKLAEAMYAQAAAEQATSTSEDGSAATDADDDENQKMKKH